MLPVSRRRISHFALAAIALLLVCSGSLDTGRASLPHPSPRFTRPAHALFADDFSDGLKLWDADREGVWSIRRGMLCADLPDEKQERSFLYAGSEEWTDYAVDLDVCGMRGVDKGLAVRVQGTSGIGIDLRGPGYQDVVVHKREWPLGRAPVVNGNSVWHHLRVEVQGPRMTVFVNGEEKINRKDARIGRIKGRIALAAYTGGVAECTVYFDNVVVTALP